MPKTGYFQMGTIGANVTTSDPGNQTPWDFVVSGGQNTFQYDSVAYIGNISGKGHNSQNGAINFGWNYTADTEDYGRLYAMFDTYPTLNSPVTLVNYTTSGSNCGGICLNTSGQLLIADTGLTYPLNNIISLNKWFRIEWHLIQRGFSDGDLELRFFSDPSSFGATERLLVTGKTFRAETDSITFQSTFDNGANSWWGGVTSRERTWPGPINPSGQPVLSHMGRVSGG